jgi:hypothetical protein
VQDHHSFEYCARVPVNGRQFVNFDADADAHAARQAVRAWTDRLGDDRRHLRWLRRQGGIGWDGLNSAIAARLAGKQASAAFLAAAAGLDRSIDWQRALAEDCHQLAALSSDPTQFRDVIADRISTTRAQLKLGPTANPMPEPAA